MVLFYRRMRRVGSLLKNKRLWWLVIILVLVILISMVFRMASVEGFEDIQSRIKRNKNDEIIKDIQANMNQGQFSQNDSNQNNPFNPNRFNPNQNNRYKINSFNTDNYEKIINETDPKYIIKDDPSKKILLAPPKKLTYVEMNDEKTRLFVNKKILGKYLYGIHDNGINDNDIYNFLALQLYYSYRSDIDKFNFYSNINFPFENINISENPHAGRFNKQYIQNQFKSKFNKGTYSFSTLYDVLNEYSKGGMISNNIKNVYSNVLPELDKYYFDNAYTGGDINKIRYINYYIIEPLQILFQNNNFNF